MVIGDILDVETYLTPIKHKLRLYNYYTALRITRYKKLIKPNLITDSRPTKKFPTYKTIQKQLQDIVDNLDEEEYWLFL